MNDALTNEFIEDLDFIIIAGLGVRKWWSFPRDIQKHLLPDSLIKYSQEVATLYERLVIERHFKMCPSCHSTFIQSHLSFHPILPQLAHYALGDDYWDRISVEEEKTIDDHIFFPESNDLKCHRCFRIIHHLADLDQETLFRLRHNDPITLGIHSYHLEKPSITQYALLNFCDSMINSTN